MTGSSAVSRVGILLCALGCVSSSAAIPLASQRSRCPRENITEIEKSTNVALLDVCGERQRWEWDPVEGYEFAGVVPQPAPPVPAQPTPPPAPLTSTMPASTPPVLAPAPFLPADAGAPPQ